jgi:hypothetical protein
MQGYAGDKYTPMVGEGHITILPWHYSAIIAGTWAFNADGAAIYYGYWRNSSSDDSDQVDYKVYLDAGTYTITYCGLVHTTMGILDTEIDEVSQGTLDWYGATARNVLKSITGIVIATAGLKTLGVLANGKNGSSTDYYLGISSISLYRTA